MSRFASCLAFEGRGLEVRFRGCGVERCGVQDLGCGASRFQGKGSEVCESEVCKGSELKERLEFCLARRKRVSMHA